MRRSFDDFDATDRLHNETYLRGRIGQLESYLSKLQVARSRWLEVIEQAQEEYCLELDQDIEYHPDYLQAVWERKSQPELRAIKKRLIDASRERLLVSQAGERLIRREIIARLEEEIHDVEDAIRDLRQRLKQLGRESFPGKFN